MKNRFMLAPMTNQQSAEDGTLTEDELHWLKVRAGGGYAHIVTCACHVQENGQGFLASWASLPTGILPA
jgi:2,4-dienoyl-CoA reductase-like NADH-dependent reductase (Old Yellow Enzyme family)